MANKRISELPLKVTPDDADFIPLVDTQTGINNYTSKKTTVGGLMSRVDELAAAQIALQKGVAGGLATLEAATGKVPSSQLPSYVDDVEEYPTAEDFPVVGETGKLYVALDDRRSYRWTGSIYIEISASPGSTDSVPEGLVNKYFTEQRAADAAPVQSVNGYVGDIELDQSDVGLGNVDNTSDANKPVSTATQTALNAKADLTDARFSDSREWTAETVSQAEAEAGTATTRRAFTALRVFQAIGAWWNASAAKTKLDGIATGATANATNEQLRDRSTHTGTQEIATVSGLQTALDGKANTTHGHAIGDVSGLQGALDGKAPSAGSTDITTVGAVTATSVNKVIVTQPTNTATLTIANNKVLTANNTMTLISADSANVNLGAGGVVVYENSIIDGGAY